jgi:translation initiation factor 2 gamma subunit (eIF-2gamma)
MRRIVYGSAILAGALLVAIALEHLPRVATTSHDMTASTIDVLKLQQVIDAKILPRQELPDEVYR